MSRRTINPKGMYDSLQYGFSHAVESAGGRTIHCAGQVAWDDVGHLVGARDLGSQAAQVFRNLRRVLAEAGATPADVVRMRTYVVDYSLDKLSVIGPAIAAFYDGAVPAANTLVGVQALALPEFLIEVEVTAVVD